MQFFDDIIGFEWDKGNDTKNYLKHLVSIGECEEVFFNVPLLILPDEKHSEKEVRLYALGKTNNGRLLYVVFTIRQTRVRVISARDMSKKERADYKK